MIQKGNYEKGTMYTACQRHDKLNENKQLGKNVNKIKSKHKHQNKHTKINTQNDKTENITNAVNTTRRKVVDICFEGL